MNPRSHRDNDPFPSSAGASAAPRAGPPRVAGPPMRCALNSIFSRPRRPPLGSPRVRRESMHPGFIRGAAHRDTYRRHLRRDRNPRRSLAASPHRPSPGDVGAPRKSPTGWTFSKKALTSTDLPPRPRVSLTVATSPRFHQDDILRRAVAQYKGKNWKKIGARPPHAARHPRRFERPRTRLKNFE